MPPATHKPRSPMLPLLAFAVALAIATFFMGDIGVYNDDYFCNQRDMTTGEAHDLVMNRPWHVWRPLTRRVLTPLITIFWNQPWALHAISAALHAAIVALMYGLLCRFGARAGIAGVVALGFMVYPLYFEAVLWNAIICTLMSIVLVLLIWHGHLWWLTSSQRRAPGVRLAALAAFGALAWAAAAFNEQPPGALAPLIAAPLVVGAAAGTTPRRRFVRSLLPVVSVTIGLGLYLHGFFKHMGPRQAEAAESLPRRLAELAEKIPDALLLRDFGAGAFGTGINSIAAHPIRGAAAFGLLALLGLGWVLGRRSDARPAPTDPSERDSRRFGTLAGLGLAWSFCTWLPVAATHALPLPRLHYVSCIGLAIAAAGGLSWAGLRWGSWIAARGRPKLMVLRAGFAMLVGAALVAWIGIQTGFQNRWRRADRTEIAPLVRVFGTTLEPDAILLPVRIDSRVLTTSSRFFDGYFQHTWFWSFSSGWRVQQDLRRPSVWTVITASGVGKDGLWLSDDDPEHRGVLRARLAIPRPPQSDTLFPRTSDHQGRDLPWDRAVLFDLAGAGNCRIYTKIRLHVPGRDPIVIVPRQIAISPAAATLPEYVLDVYPIPPNRRHTRMPT